MTAKNTLRSKNVIHAQNNHFRNENHHQELPILVALTSFYHGRLKNNPLTPKRTTHLRLHALYKIWGSIKHEKISSRKVRPFI
jgi:hypothetical protein